jgi:hypothetical protein
MAIRLDQPIWFLDGTRKCDNMLRLERILWQDASYVLCAVVEHIFDEDATDHSLNPMKWEQKTPSQPILFVFDKKDLISDFYHDGQVLNVDYATFDATNDISKWRPFGW